MISLDQWRKLSQNARMTALLDGTAPAPHPTLDKSEMDRLIAHASSKPVKSSMMHGLNWFITHPDGSITQRFGMPCWGELITSTSGHRHVSGLFVDMGYVPEKDLANEWYKFILGSGMWPGLAAITNQLNENHFVLTSLNFPSQLLINYLIALRIPARNPPAVQYWAMWQEKGASPLAAYILTSFCFPAKLDQKKTETEVWYHPQRHEYPLTGKAVVRNRASLSRIVSNRPLLNAEYAFVPKESILGNRCDEGIPNNRIWETRGRAPHFMTPEIANRFKDAGVLRKFMNDVSEFMPTVEALEARLKEIATRRPQ